VIAAWLAGCAYTVALTSTPMPARVALPDGRIVATPTEARLRWAPFGHQVVTATAPGYRPLTVDLRRDEVTLGRWVATSVFRPATWFGAPRGEVRLVLVEEHGPAGTWGGEAAP
jgi:hypothetical protein